MVSLGDTGNGFLSAIAIVQALYHRDRTGEGQFVDTSIMYAQLLNTSIAWATADGVDHRRRARRSTPCSSGAHALYRLYKTADGWLCVAAVDDAHRAALAGVLGVAGRPPTPRSTRSSRCSRTRPATEWFTLLDAAGVPCEVSTPDFVLDLFDDPEMIEKGWVTSYRHPVVGEHGHARPAVRLLGDPGVGSRDRRCVPGQDTRSILHELGYDDEQDRQAATVDWAESGP